MRQPAPRVRRSTQNTPNAHTPLRRARALLVAVAAAGAGLVGLRGFDDAGAIDRPQALEAAEAATRATVDERLGHHLQRLR